MLVTLAKVLGPPLYLMSPPNTGSYNSYSTNPRVSSLYTRGLEGDGVGLGYNYGYGCGSTKYSKTDGGGGSFPRAGNGESKPTYKVKHYPNLKSYARRSLHGRTSNP